MALHPAILLALIASSARVFSEHRAVPRSTTSSAQPRTTCRRLEIRRMPRKIIISISVKAREEEKMRTTPIANRYPRKKKRVLVNNLRKTKG